MRELPVCLALEGTGFRRLTRHWRHITRLSSPVLRVAHADNWLVLILMMLAGNVWVFIAGRAWDGSLIDDGPIVWLLKREDGALLAADYTYRWDRLDIAVGSPLPDPRTEHTAVAISGTEILVFGGIRKPPGQGETPTNQLWRLFKDGAVWGCTTQELHCREPSLCGSLHLRSYRPQGGGLHYRREATWPAIPLRPFPPTFGAWPRAWPRRGRCAAARSRSAT